MEPCDFHTFSKEPCHKFSYNRKGTSGTHSVCVCTAHQNVKLLLDAVSIQETYKDLMALLVCDVSSSMCMIHRCPNCPEKDVLQNHLEQKLICTEETEDVAFSQWMATDRPDLIRQTLPMDEFITLLTKKLDDLTSHSFISKEQSSYLKHLKEKLTPNECVVLLDFAENYSFMVQDEVQSFFGIVNSALFIQL